MHRLTLSILCLLALTGCSGASHRPIVDYAASPGKTQQTYEADLTQCQEYAEQVSTSQSAGRGALGGAALGGAMSGVFGAITGQNFGTSVGAGAAAGAIGGTAGGAATGEQAKTEVINNCMRGRGYSVLR